MDLHNNPRVDIERRIKQVTLRRQHIMQHKRFGLNIFNGQPSQLVFTGISATKEKQASRLIKECNHQLTGLWVKLKTF